MILTTLGTLGPEIKVFLAAVSIAGPVAIGILFVFIKRIEKQNPDRIRWR